MPKKKNKSEFCSNKFEEYFDKESILVSCSNFAVVDIPIDDQPPSAYCFYCWNLLIYEKKNITFVKPRKELV